MFTLETLQKLKKSGKVNGMILMGVNNNNPMLQAPEQHSDDSKCPNSMSSLYKNTAQACPARSQPWNPAGSEILMKDWSFPIFLVDNQTMIEKLVNCYKDFNSGTGESQSWPLCAIELISHMIAAVDSKTCHRSS